MNAEKTVVILGASANEERHSNRALRLLMEKGYPVIPVHPTEKEINGISVVNDLANIHSPVDTITIYLSPDKSEPLKNKILSLKPMRVIFNPGTESKELSSIFREQGIEVVEGCTIVMLTTGQF